MESKDMAHVPSAAAASNAARANAATVAMPRTTQGRVVAPRREHVRHGNGQLAHELVPGALVRYSDAEHPSKAPTAVLLHGILGQKKNLSSFAQQLARNHPSWNFLLVDLRCHGASAQAASRLPRPHDVTKTAADVLNLLGDLKLFPHMLVGHSFGGKVALSMVDQFGSTLPRPVQVWVLDALPGEVRAMLHDRQDSPRRLIQALQEFPVPTGKKSTLVSYLENRGFSKDISRWATTNLVQRPQKLGNQYTWQFDLDGITEMFDSYERENLWGVLEAPPQGLKLDFVKAERSVFRWGGIDEGKIRDLGHHVHLLRNAGHWVHSDNPAGLEQIMHGSFTFRKPRR